MSRRSTGTNSNAEGWGERFAYCASSEFVLSRAANGNGGAVVLLRALTTSTGAFAVLFAIVCLCQTKSFLFRDVFVDKLPWYGAMFGAVYAALYARFAGHWAYLAGLYNQIKSVEATCAATAAKYAEASEGNASSRPMIEWKQGFVDDAKALRLDKKAIFAEAVCEWEKEIEAWKQSRRQRVANVLDESRGGLSPENSRPRNGEADASGEHSTAQGLQQTMRTGS